MRAYTYDEIVYVSASMGEKRGRTLEWLEKRVPRRLSDEKGGIM